MALTSLIRSQLATIRPLLNDRFVRFFDVFRAPGGLVLDVPFNGQAARVALFREVTTRIPPAALVETGTFKCATTRFFAESGLPTLTVEYGTLLFLAAKFKLRSWRNVTVALGDSRSALRRWFAGPLRLQVNGAVFFYLDAHWNADLPLADEVDLIFRNCPAAVVLVDDFKVPDDPGYGFDERLTPDYIAPVVRAHSLCGFYPATPSDRETGKRRGTILVARADQHGRVLSQLPLLRPAGIA